MAKTKINADLVDILQERGLLTPEQVQQVRTATESGVQPEQILLEQQWVSIEQITEARAQLFRMPYKNLVEEKVPMEVLGLIPRQVAANYRFVAFERQPGMLKIGVVDPQDIKALDALQFIADKNNLQTELYLISEQSFTSAFDQYSELEAEVSAVLQPEITENELGHSEEKIEDAQLAETVRTAPVSQAVATILKHAVQQGASDIHIEPLEKNIRVRYRIDGILSATLTLPKKILPAIVSRIKILSNLKIDELRLPQDGRFHSMIDGRSIDFRVSTMPTVDGEKVVMRILDRTKNIYSLEGVGLSGQRLNDVRATLQKTVGIFLLTGPTGSGKTTTLYASLTIVNREGVNIVTLEDPVEYFIDGVNQSQIRPEIGFTFANGLRSILRQDPDGVMVGEIRDGDTAEMAVHAALTGHIVLSTLHTNSAAGAIPRMIDLGVEPFLLSSALDTIAAQRLVRTICTYCKEESTEVEKEMQEFLTKELAKIPAAELDALKIKKPLKLYRGLGCKQCRGTGYLGRIGIYEVIPVSEEIKALILQRPTADAVREVAAKQGKLSLFQDGLLKSLAGFTTLEEVMRVTK